jgi:hypothetical protein
MFRRNVTVGRADASFVSALPKAHFFASAGGPHPVSVAAARHRWSRRCQRGSPHHPPRR